MMGTAMAARCSNRSGKVTGPAATLQVGWQRCRWAVALLCAGSVARGEPSPYRRGTPTDETANVVTLIEKDAAAGCERVAVLIESGSTDPFAVRALAMCPRVDANSTQRADRALAHAAPALRAYHDGARAWYFGRLEAAEPALRKAVQLAPDLALAWNTLGAVVKQRGDMAESASLFRRALELAPDLEMARINLVHTELLDAVYERLQRRLEEIPARWQRLPRPVVAPSGRSVQDIYNAAPESAVSEAFARVRALASTPLNERTRAVAELATGAPSELLLWTPSVLAEGRKLTDEPAAAITLEAGLQLAEAFGRTDALFVLAAQAFGLRQSRVEPARRLAAERRWRDLPFLPVEARGRAHVSLALAAAASTTGDYEEALAAYRAARAQFSTLGDKLALADAWLGEARVLNGLERFDAAADAFMKSREFSIDAGSTQQQASAELGAASVLLRRGKYQAALDAYRAVRALFSEIGDKRGDAEALKGQADALFRLGRNDDALENYSAARALYSEVNDKRGMADTFRAEADVLLRLGRQEGALEAYHEARARYTAIDDRIGQAETLSREADALVRIGRNDAALSVYRHARAIFAAVGARKGEANTLLGEADVEMRFGNLDEAFERYRHARAIFAELSDRQGEANTWQGEAQVLLLRGRYHEALSSFLHARVLFDSLSDTLGSANTRLGEAQILFLLGRSEESLVAFREAYAAFETAGSKLGQANALQGQARIICRRDHKEDCFSANIRVRDLFESIGDRLGLANSWLDEAEAQFFLGRDDEALVACDRAHRYFESMGEDQGLASTRLIEARIAWYRRDWAALLRAAELAGAAYGSNPAVSKGEVLLLQAIALHALHRDDDARNRLVAAQAADPEKLGPLRPEDLNRLLTPEKVADRQSGSISIERIQLERTTVTIGDPLEQLVALGYDLQPARKRISEIEAAMREAERLDAAGKLKEGLRQAERALASLRELRNAGRGDLDRLSLAQAGGTRVYDFLVPRLAAVPRTAMNALALVDEAHSPVLLDGLRSDRTASQGSVTLQDEQQNIREELAHLPNNNDDETRRKRTDVEDRLERNLLRQELQLASHPTDAVDPAALTAAVKAVGPILFFYVREDSTTGFLLTPEITTPIVAEIALGRREIADLARRLRYDLANPFWERHADATLDGLRQKLLAPFLTHLEKHATLVVVPHGPLHLVPFEALVERADSSAGEKLAVASAPSASAVLVLANRQNRRRPSHEFYAVASGHGLSLTDLEIARIAQFFPAAARAESRAMHATIERFRRVAPSVAHLLMATHGVHVEGRPFSTYLELVATDQEDGRLRAGDVSRMQLQLLDLVTLAACDTARAEALSSDERLDFTRAFLLAGASSVLATRWKIPDSDKTTEFLVDFYRGLREQHLSKAEALREARKAAQARKDPAQVWAAFVLVGDPR